MQKLVLNQEFKLRLKPSSEQGKSIGILEDLQF